MTPNFPQNSSLSHYRGKGKTIAPITTYNKTAPNKSTTATPTSPCTNVATV